MSRPQVYLTVPSFGFIPEPLPRALPPPVKECTFRSPFGIDPDLYNFVLRPEIPITFAALYILAVFSLNAYNRRRAHRSWWIARQSFFTYFVVIHNALLTIYSAATFAAMARAIAHTWPGLDTRTGLAGMADALCKLHGPRGLGDAATFNTTINIWEAKNSLIHLGYDGNPDPTDVGRLWNEGLAFWGWFFYISKFYEVLDTLIILAKGKRSATLQTYHHSGAMLCMWAGIRYMSPPIWMFVFVNSFIHALMYAYFTLAAIGVRVPLLLKRSLTSLQIAQLLWGASYAAAHLFIQYDIPIATPYQVASVAKAAASSVSSVASVASATVSKVIESPVASATLVALVKKLLLRAVGEEGIAERVTNDPREPFTQQIEDRIGRFNAKSSPPWETRWRRDWTKVDCIDTSGEAFAIYLNLLYLAPLTFLFARFFVKAYTGRGKARRASYAAKQVIDSGKVAGERTEEIVEQLGRKGEEIIEKEAHLFKVDVKDVHEQLRRDVQAMKNGTWGRERRVSDHVENFERQVRSAAEKAKEESRQLFSGSGSPRRSSPSKRIPDVPQSTESILSDEPGTPREPIAMEAVTHPEASSESKHTQEHNLSTSHATRPGVDDTDENKENQPPSINDLAARLESTIKEVSNTFSENLAESQSTQIESTDDTDAMGKSGAIVDYPENSKHGDKDFPSEESGERDFPSSTSIDELGGDDKPIFRPPGTISP